MIFTETNLQGAFIIDIERLEDERGFFARSWCRKEFTEKGLCHDFVQCNISYNKYKATLRGMHYQIAPFEEIKLVRCTKGSIYDVIVDIRPKSSTFKRWESFELSAENRQALYIPEGFAHGFQTLENDTEVLYQMSQYYSPEHARGIRWNELVLAIDWPIAKKIISKKDQSFPEYT